MTEWFFQLGGNALGPITAQRLAEMALDGRLAIGDLVRRDDQSVWVRAEQLQGLKFATISSSPSVALETSASGASNTSSRRRLSAELKSIAAATLGHISHIPDWLLLRFGLWRNRRETRKFEIEYGRELFEAGRGSQQEQEILQAVITELATADAKQIATLNLRRDELFAALSRSSSDLGALKSSAADRLVRLSKGESEIRARLIQIQSRLLPSEATDRRRITLGYAALGFFVLAMLFAFGGNDRERVDAGVTGVVAVSASPPSETTNGVTGPAKAIERIVSPRDISNDSLRQAFKGTYEDDEGFLSWTFLNAVWQANSTKRRFIADGPGAYDLITLDEAGKPSITSKHSFALTLWRLDFGKDQLVVPIVPYLRTDGTVERFEVLGLGAGPFSIQGSQQQRFFMNRVAKPTHATRNPGLPPERFSRPF